MAAEALGLDDLLASALGEAEGGDAGAGVGEDLGAGDACSAAEGGGAQTFEILDGVRRAKAADLVGNSTIPAEIIGADGRLIGTQNVPINQLLSPKPSIDVSTVDYWDRFMNTLNQTKAGSVPPPIKITPGVNGTPIPNVPLDPLGPH